MSIQSCLLNQYKKDHNGILSLKLRAAERVLSENKQYDPNLPPTVIEKAFINLAKTYCPLVLDQFGEEGIKRLLTLSPNKIVKQFKTALVERNFNYVEQLIKLVAVKETRQEMFYQLSLSYISDLVLDDNGILHINFLEDTFEGTVEHLQQAERIVDFLRPDLAFLVFQCLVIRYERNIFDVEQSGRLLQKMENKLYQIEDNEELILKLYWLIDYYCQRGNNLEAQRIFQDVLRIFSQLNKTSIRTIKIIENLYGLFGNRLQRWKYYLHASYEQMHTPKFIATMSISVVSGVAINIFFNNCLQRSALSCFLNFI